MVSDAGFAPNSPVIVQTLLHVSQIAASRDIYRNTWAASLAGELLADLVPMEKHAGTVIQGDQDALNFRTSVDVLALSDVCHSQALAITTRLAPSDADAATIPAEDLENLRHNSARRHEGVFQSHVRRCRCCRRLKPKAFCDRIIEVAIVRAGPIQGDKVHPYLAAAFQQLEFQLASLEIFLSVAERHGGGHCSLARVSKEREHVQ